MADHIQAQIDIVHHIADTNPTDSSNPTQSKEIDNVTEQKKTIGRGEDNKDFIDWVTSTSVKRRVANTIMDAGQFAINYQIDKKMFQQTLYGNTRGANLLQNQKTNLNAWGNTAKSLVGGIITAVATENPLLFGIIATQQAVRYAQNFIQYKQQISQYNMQREKAIYESQFNKDRLVQGSYNRRR